MDLSWRKSTYSFHIKITVNKMCWIFSSGIICQFSKKWNITALTRNADTIPKFKELGVTPLLGSLDDSELLTKAAADADVVMHIAHSDSMPAIKALVKGLSTAGKRRILIHTSGTGELTDDARGEYPTHLVYSDLDVKAIRALPPTQIHKDVDSYIFDNSQEFDSIIVAPPTIYGIGTGLYNRYSIQIPLMVRGFLKFGYAATVGKGMNIWNNVHVEDLADLYILLLQKSLDGKASTGKDGWYFCESGEHYLKDVVAKIGEEMFKRKAIKQAEPVEFTPDQVEEYLGKSGLSVIGENSRCRADRARELGWKASGKKGTIYDCIKEDVEFILNEEKKKLV